MNKRNKFLVLNLLIVFLLVGCVTMKLVKPQKTSWKKGKFSSVLPVGWVKYTGPGMILSLTREGSLLQFITISKTKTGKELPKTKKKITEDLLLQEVAEIIEDELSLAEGISDFVLLSKKPVTLGGLEAFRLEYKYKTKDLVAYHGITHGFLFKKRYYEIQYWAMEQHYYDASIKALNEFIENFKVDS